MPVLARKTIGYPSDSPGEIEYYTVEDALTLEFRVDDAHFTSYSSEDFPSYRLNQEIFRSPGEMPNGIRMVLVVFDVDGVKTEGAAWREEFEPKIQPLLDKHPGAFVYSTKNGYRIVYLAPDGLVLHTVADTVLWKSFYLGWCNYLRSEFGIVADKACQEWNRIFRAPHVCRDGQFSRAEKVWGSPHSLGLWEVGEVDASDTCGPPAEVVAEAAGLNLLPAEPHYSDRSEARARAKELRTEAVRILADHWVPDKNTRVEGDTRNRNSAKMALAGGLGHLKFTSTQADEFMDELAAMVGDQNVGARRNIVRQTYQKNEVETPVTGFPALGKLIGESATQAVKARLQRSLSVVNEGLFDGFTKQRQKSAEETPAPTDGILGQYKNLFGAAVVGKVSINELADRPVIWLWKNVCSAGQKVLLAAAPSSGKTTLLGLIVAARSNTSGEPITVLGLEMLPAPEDKYIVMIEAEHSDESAARIIKKSLALQGISDDAMERIILVARKGVRLGDPVWNDIEKLILAGKVSDVVLDTLARVAPIGDDPNDEASQVGVFDTIDKVIELAPKAEDRPTFWVATHLRKVDGIPTLNDVAGSTQRAGQSDIVLLMAANRVDQRVKSVNLVFGKVREKDPEDWPKAVEFVVSKSGIVVVDAPETDDRPLTEQIVTRLELGIPLSKGHLRSKLNRSAADVEEAISELFKDRRIQRTSVKVRGKECPAYMLRPDGTAEQRENYAKRADGLKKILDQGNVMRNGLAGGGLNGHGRANGMNGHAKPTNIIDMSEVILPDAVDGPALE